MCPRSSKGRNAGRWSRAARSSTTPTRCPRRCRRPASAPAAAASAWWRSRRASQALSPRTTPEAYLPEGLPPRLPGAHHGRPTRTWSSASCAAGCASWARRRTSTRTSTRWSPSATASSTTATCPWTASRTWSWAWPWTSARPPSCSSSSTCSTGKAVAGSAMENPQRFGGSDVMARISFERDRPGELRDALRRQLNHELRDIYARLGIDRSEVYEAVIVANTTMRDMFFGLDVTPIGESPYRSLDRARVPRGPRATTTTISRLAHQVGLLVGPRARVIGAPLISGHVGADIAADLVALDFGSKPGISPAGGHRHQHGGGAHGRRRATSRRPARRVPPSRVASSASACRARTAPSRRCASRRAWVGPSSTTPSAR